VVWVDEPVIEPALHECALNSATLTGPFAAALQGRTQDKTAKGTRHFVVAFFKLETAAEREPKMSKRPQVISVTSLTNKKVLLDRLLAFMRAI
jgi:hypothetical protein